MTRANMLYPSPRIHLPLRTTQEGQREPPLAAEIAGRVGTGPCMRPLSLGLR